MSLITPKTGGGYNVSGDLDAEFSGPTSGVYLMRFHHDHAGHTAGDEVGFFDSGVTKGLVKFMRDRNGNDLQTSYVGSGTQVDQVVDTQSRPFDYTYTSGRVTQIDDTNGSRNVQYVYDGNGDLREFVDALGNSTYYDDYDSDHNPQSIIAPNELIQVTYDAKNRVTGVYSTAASYVDTTIYTYDDTLGLDGFYGVTVTDANAHDTTYRFDNANRVALVTDALGAPNRPGV